MNTSASAQFIALASFGLLFYTYVAYPLLLWLLSLPKRLKEAPHVDDLPEWPRVSILISAFNEEAMIGDRLRNLLEVRYPAERMEILVGSDGSDDATCDVIRGFECHGVRLFAFTQRRGKAAVLNDLMRSASNDLIVLTDANAFFHANAVQELVRALSQHQTACAVVGRLRLGSAVEAGNLDGAYWRYETWIKTLESRFGCVLGANGAIYALRRERYEPLPEGAIVDDFLIPILIRIRSGGPILFVPSAIAWERSPERVRDEFRRRVRIGAGNLQALMWTWRLLLPSRGMVAATYFSHKILRWFGPWFMLIGLAATLSLRHTPLFHVLLVGQLLFYGLGSSARLLQQVPVLGVASSAIWYFIVLNAALLVGFAQFASGDARPFWHTTPRKADRAGAGVMKV